MRIVDNERLVSKELGDKWLNNGRLEDYTFIGCDFDLDIDGVIVSDCVFTKCRFAGRVDRMMILGSRFENCIFEKRNNKTFSARIVWCFECGFQNINILTGAKIEYFKSECCEFKQVTLQDVGLFNRVSLDDEFDQVINKAGWLEPAIYIRPTITDHELTGFDLNQIDLVQPDGKLTAKKYKNKHQLNIFQGEDRNQS